MLDKIDAESIGALLSIALASIMQFLSVLVEQPQRSFKYQFVDVVVCGFYGFAVFLLCNALDLHMYIAYVVSIIVGKLGVLQTTMIIEKIINKKL